MRFEIVSGIDRNFLLMFSMTRGEWFEFETLKDVLIDGGHMSLKILFSLERHMEVFEDMVEDLLVW